MKKLLLQVCCAPCGTYTSLERLAPRYDLTWYFYNPNLLSQEEYDKRLAAVKFVAEKFNWPLIVEPYDHAPWREKACPHAASPERGTRCLICYHDRLAKTAAFAKENGFELFGTTLLVSPYKDTAAILALGHSLSVSSGVEFLAEDFQSDDGYRRSQELAKDLGLYRQKFCGCEYSLPPKSSRRSLVSSLSLIILLFLSFTFLAGIFLAPAKAAALDNPTPLDSDGDGYPDALEIQNGYSPFNPDQVKIKDSDMDKDGLSDYWELKFKTDPLNPDTDGDGYSDGEEIDWGYDPLSASPKKLPEEIGIDLAKQTLTYYVAHEAWKEFPVSSGKASMPTPQGSFHILNKVKKAWSKAYGLWMPYWLGLDHGEFGIHELPVWPSGYREGENHLGTPVSHGCIRLGIGSAQYIYDRVATGTEVIIK